MTDNNDVKISEVFYIREFVETSRYKGEHFTIPYTVDRVTNTQFLLSDGNRYRKDNLRIVSSKESYSASREGVDQSKEKEAFEAKKLSIMLLKDSIYNLDHNRNQIDFYKLSHEEVIRYDSDLSKLLSLVKS